MTSFALPLWRRVAEQPRMLLHRTGCNPSSSADCTPALARIERRNQLLAVGGTERRSAEALASGAHLKMRRRAVPRSCRQDLQLFDFTPEVGFIARCKSGSGSAM